MYAYAKPYSSATVSPYTNPLEKYSIKHSVYQSQHKHLAVWHLISLFA